MGDRESQGAQIALHGRKFEDFSEDELEIVVADEEAKIRQSFLKRLATVAFLLGIGIGIGIG